MIRYFLALIVFGLSTWTANAIGVPSPAMMFTGSQGNSGGGPLVCTNSGANLCFLLGAYDPGGGDSGASTWMGRYWDFTAALVGQNQCGLNYPLESGADNPTPGSPYADYTTEVPANSGCTTKPYTWKTNNEWWLNCNGTNPWQTNATPTVGGTCLAESMTPVVSPATWISRVCTMVTAIRAQYPNAKVSWYGPSNDREAMFDPSGTCTIDAYEIHVYIYGDNQQGRTGQGDWNGGTPYSCGPQGGILNQFPHDVMNCTANTALAYLPNYAKAHGNKPINMTEVCSGYNDTASPTGHDYATTAIAEWAKFNNVGSIQWWAGPVGNASNCDISGPNAPGGGGNKRAAMNDEFGGTHYAGTFYTYQQLPMPNPYPWLEKRKVKDYAYN